MSRDSRTLRGQWPCTHPQQQEMVKRSQPFCTNTSSMKFGLIKCPQYARHKHQRLNKKEYLTFKQRVVMQSYWQGPMLRHTVRLRVFQQMGQLWPLNCTHRARTGMKFWTPRGQQLSWESSFVAPRSGTPFIFNLVLIGLYQQKRT